MVVNQNALADRIKCLFPNSLTTLSAIFAFTQRVLGFFALGDIDNVGQNIIAFISPYGIQTDLDRDFTSVFAAAIQIATCSHNPSNRITQKAFPLSSMRRQQALG